MMQAALSRRALLRGGAGLVAAAAMDWGGGKRAFAARDRLVVRLVRDALNLDPPYRTGPAEVEVFSCIYRSLVTLKPGTTEIVNDAVESIRQVGDTVIEFKLKPNLMFTDGFGEMTTEDVKFSFERFNLPGPEGKKSAYAKDWAALQTVEIVDKYTGRLVLTGPSPAMWLIALPSGSGVIVSKKAVEKLGSEIGRKPVGNGPYVLAEWVPQQRLVLKASPTFVGDRPPFREIVFRPIQDDKTAELAFRANELDFTQIDPTSAKAVALLPDANLVVANTLTYLWLGLNGEKPPFDDLRVRRAVRLAVDVDQILQGAYDGHATRARALLAPGQVGHWREAPTYQRDLAAAKKLLAEAGRAGGFKARLTHLNQSIFKTAATIIQANLQEVGIDVEIQSLDAGTFWSMGKGEEGKRLDMFLMQYRGDLDPGFNTQWFVSEQVGVWNWNRWVSRDFDRLDALGRTTLDAGKRTDAYIQMQKLMDESGSFIWIAHPVFLFASKKWLRPALLPNADKVIRGFREA
jgi:peptide/nickel transport system substrate-binding protein